MKAIRITEHGSPETLRIMDMPVPEPSDDEVLIRVHAAGVNFAEILSRRGMYPDAPPLPFTPGYEVAGTVEKTGRNVTGLETGQRVAALTDFGGYAGYALAVPAFTAPLGDAVSFIYGAAVPVNWITAYHSIFHTGPVTAGDRALVHAAAGGVGIAAVQLLKAAGCVVFGTAGSAQKVKFLKNLGVDYPIHYRENDFMTAVNDIIGPRGLDLVIDSIGGDYIRKGVKLLRANGRLIVLGVASFVGKSRAAITWRYWRKFMISPYHLLGNSHGVYGVNVKCLIKQRPDLCERVFRTVMNMLNAGEIVPVIDSMYPLEGAAEAHARLESRKTIGKVILVNE